MKQKCTTWAALAASIFVGGALATKTQGQSSDALLNALIKKGIISEKEAQDIKAEATKETAKEINQTFSAKTGMPAWINSYKLYGDFRGRFEENHADNFLYHDRDRYRYRLRLGLNISMLDNFDVGLRLSSGDPASAGANAGAAGSQSNPGGQPITANQTLGSLNTRKFIWIDAAYGRWTPIKNNDWTVSATIGKMDNPFQLSNMIWDYDINPEGVALQASYNINDQHALKANGAWFLLDEINQGGGFTNTAFGVTNSVPAGHDPYVVGGQLLLESKWTPKIDTSFGVAAFNIVHKESLGGLIQPFYNAGNSRDVNGFLKHHYDPLIGSGSATYKLATFPGYAGQFPVKVGGEYIYNPSPSTENKGWRAGLTLGKAGRKGTWELNYRYQRLEADAWYDALVDDDNGAFIVGSTSVPFTPANDKFTKSGYTPLSFRGAGRNFGWFGGTNVKGHQVIATYSFTDFLNFTFIYYLNDAIITSTATGPAGQRPLDTRSDASHFMADLNWKF